MMWYTKYNLINRSGDILCPNCLEKLEEQLFYSIDYPYSCPNCSSKNVIIRDVFWIYIVDIGKAPKLFLVMYEYLRNQSQSKAYEELKKIKELFADPIGVDEIKKGLGNSQQE